MKLAAILTIFVLSILSYNNINKKILFAEYDTSDAPFSYGLALHAEPAKGPYLGKNKGDGELVSTVKNTKFNDSENNIADEDAFAFLNNYLVNDSNICPYVLDKKQKNLTIALEVNNVKEGDPIKAWVDLNGNGKFEKFEKTETYCNATSKIVALSWNISEVTAIKSTYLRIRICDKDYENHIEQPDTKTKTGEVEDYRIFII